MNVELLTKFANLTPTEVAVLWMSTRSTPTTPQANRANVVVRADHVEVTIPIPQKEGREEVILCSKPTMVLGCLLAEGFARMEEQSSESIVTALASFTRDKIKLAADNPQSRFDIRPYSSDLHSLLFEYLLKIPGFSLPDDFYKYEKPIDHAMEKCLMAVSALEDKGLIVDPPWKKLVTGFMLCFLGIFPTDFSIRDKPGDEIVDYIRYETRLWEFERTVSDKEITTHFQANSRLAGMLDNTMAALARNYLDGWSAANPDQQRKLQEHPSNPRLE